MSKTTLGFLFSGLIYLLLGVTLGALFFIFPQFRALKLVHVHLTLVGFVIFAIFGIGYHILPRFRGNPLHSESLAWVQFWLANIGLVGLLIFMGIGAFHGSSAIQAAEAVFGSILAISFYLFIYNMFVTLKGKKEA